MPSPPASTFSRLAAVLFVALLALVVWGSLKRLEPSAAGHLDKVQHFAAYATLTALGFAAAGRRSWPLLAGVAALGAGVEVLQALLPTGRTGSVLDALANTAGALAAWMVWTAGVRLRS